MTRPNTLSIQRLLLVGVFLAALFVAGTGQADAQVASERGSLGAQFSVLRLSDFDATAAGVGVRGAYRLSRWIDADGEFSFFPNDDIVTASAPSFTVAYERRRISAFAGPKIGVRSERVGVFGKARPGFTRLTDEGVGCAGEVCALALLARPQYRTEFAADLGGVLELYPSRQTVARFDVGTTIIRHRSTAPPCLDCTTANFSTSLGVGWRF